MRVTHLSLLDFRNYSTAEVEFKPGANLIIGRNGQGKTNLVEAIAYFASLSSHRVTGESALIRAGSDTAVARMRIHARERDVLLEVQLNRGSPNRAQVNRNGVQPRELTRWFSAVVFAPEDLSIVRGDPARRRSFLDEALLAHNPTLVSVLSDYDRVVRQRTSLLKSARASGARRTLESTLELWDEQLIELGARIMFERRRLCDLLAVPVARSYSALVEADHRPVISMVESVYASSSGAGVSRETSTVDTDAKPDVEVGRGGDVSRETLRDAFRGALTKVRSQELDRAQTLIGPHRDDLLLELNDLPVKGYASHGESWTFALSLRLGLAELLRHELPSGDPVIILDDVFAELDARRRDRLLASVSSFEQVIVTAAVAEDVPQGPQWHRIAIRAGAVVPDGEL